MAPRLMTDRKDKVFASVTVLVHVVFFLLACHYTRIYMGDSFEYIYEALNIKQLGFFYSGNPGLPISPEYMTQRQPLYPGFLLMVYLFVVNNWVVLVLQHLLSVWNILYLRRLLVQTGYQKKYDWLLLLLVAGYPAQFINASTIAPDILLQTCTLLYAGSFIALLRLGTNRALLHMSLALVAGLLVKPVLYPFVIPHIAIAIAALWRRGRPMQRPLLLAILPLCVVLLYNGWNYTRTGKFHFTSNQAFNALYYYYPYLSQKVGADSAGRYLARERADYNAIPDYKDRYDYANDEGMTLLRRNLVPYMAFHLLHSGRILIEPGKAEMDLFTGRLTYGRLYSKEQTGLYATLRMQGIGGLPGYVARNPSLPVALVVLLLNCVRLLGLVLFFFRRSIAWQWRAFVFMLIGYFAVAAGPIANTRYFLPVSLLAIGCSVLGYMRSRDKTTFTVA